MISRRKGTSKNRKTAGPTFIPSPTRTPRASPPADTGADDMEDAGGDAGDADDEGGETDLAALAAEAATDGHRNDAAYAVKQASNVPGGETGRMRVNRDYDFDAAVPDVDPDGYVQQHQELDKWRAEVAGAIDPATSHKAGISVSGPTQIGKTLAAKCLAAEASAPFYRLQCTDGMEDADIRGDVSYVDDETWFNDSDVVQALISSQVRPTVLLIDEANRTPPQAKSALFPVLADECSVQIPGRNETVSGDPENLIVISTMNEGSEYVTYDFDFAEIPRFGRKHELTHLGMADASAETALMKRETGIAESVAMEMVDAANTIRQEAADQDFSSMDIGGVPTGVMIEWASTAQQYAGHIDDAVHEAAIDSVVTPFYPPGQGVEAHDFAMNVLSSLKGVAYENADEAGDADDMEDAGDDAENAGDADESEDAVTCLECEYRESVNDAPAAIAATLQCPECDGDVTFVDGDDSEGIGDLFS